MEGTNTEYQNGNYPAGNGEANNYYENQAESAPPSYGHPSHPPNQVENRDRDRDRDRDINRSGERNGDRHRNDRDGDRHRGRDDNYRDNRDRGRGRDDRDRGGRDDRGRRGPPGRRRSRSRSPRGAATTRVNRRGSPDRGSKRKSRSKSRSKTPPSPPPTRKRTSLWDKIPTDLDTLGQPLTAPSAAMNPNADRQARRLYVGNIPAGITEAEIQEFFNTAMTTAKATNKPGNPVASVQINAEKSYAFLEMRSQDEATAGMVFDGIMLHAHALKVRRPKDYTPMMAAATPTAEAAAPKPALPAGAIVATNVPDSAHKIFIGGIPAHLNEEQVKDLLTTFGPLKAFNLVKDTTTGISKGFAFCEYLDDGITDRACAGLNGMKLGEKQLLVQRASIGAKNPPTMPAVQVVASVPTGPLTPANVLNLSIPAITLLNTLPQLNTNIKTRVIVLLNMVSIEELRDEDEYAGVLTDVREECEKFGPVLSVTIPRPPAIPQQEEKSIFDGPIEAPPTPTEKVCPIARVYVEFENTEDCLRALNALAGRRYNAHIIVTSLYSQDLYEAGRVI